MPNWCENRLKIEGKIREIITKDEKGNDTFTFNSVIPMPPSLDIESGSSNDDDILLYITDGQKIPLDELDPEKHTLLCKLVGNIFLTSREWLEEVWKRCGRIRKEDIPEHIKTGETLVTNFLEYGAPTWYEWCIKNWGVKWDACNVEVINDNELVFLTPWAPPEEILKALSVRFPDTAVTDTWEEEGGESGCLVYINGTKKE